MRFDALSISLAELALNIMFATIFAFAIEGGDARHAQSLLEAAPDSNPIRQREIRIRDLMSENALLKQRDENAEAVSRMLKADLASERTKVNAMREELNLLADDSMKKGRSDIWPTCPGKPLFVANVLSASEIEVEGVMMRIEELDDRYRGRVRSESKYSDGCVYEIETRFTERISGADYGKALKALESRFRVRRLDS